MKKQYKIQLPKGKKVTMTNVDFENGVMTVNVELENRENFHEAIHNEVCGVFSKINNQLEEALKANGVTIGKIDEMAKESIKELEKDCPDIWDKMIQEYGEAICGNTEQKYEPKDGDFIHLKWKGIKTLLPYEEEEKEAIGIFKEIGYDMLYCYVTYFVGDDFKDNPTLMAPSDYIGNKISNGYISMFDEIRPATEREKKILIDQLEKVNKKWNPETKRIEDVRWRAKVGEKFYYIAADCIIGCMERFNIHYLWKKYDNLEQQLEDERYNNFEYEYWKKGNYFKTREAAEKAAEQIREIFKNSKAE